MCGSWLWCAAAAEVAAPEGGGATAVSLPDVCYKPFGDMCAVQSVLQYWRLDRQLFDKEQVSA